MSVKLSGRQGSTDCYRYDKVKDNCIGPECKNQTETCENDSQGSNEMPGCYAVWRNSSKDGFEIQNLGCWLTTSHCLVGTQCISGSKLAEDSFFCCCIGDLCNGDVLYQPVEEPSPEVTEPGKVDNFDMKESKIAVECVHIQEDSECCSCV